MTFVFSSLSLKRRQGLHPTVITILDLTLPRSPVDFAIICGVRTVREQIELWAQGRTTAQLRAKGITGVEGKPDMPVVTWTLNSNHFVQDSGFGHAVDICPWVNGALDWNTTKNFDKIAEKMKETAARMNVPLEWGGDWSTPDRPHFQLPKDYPAPQ